MLSHCRSCEMLMTSLGTSYNTNGMSQHALQPDHVGETLAVSLFWFCVRASKCTFEGQSHQNGARRNVPIYRESDTPSAYLKCALLLARHPLKCASFVFEGSFLSSSSEAKYVKPKLPYSVKCKYNVHNAVNKSIALNNINQMGLIC